MQLDPIRTPRKHLEEDAVRHQQQPAARVPAEQIVSDRAGPIPDILEGFGPGWVDRMLFGANFDEQDGRVEVLRVGPGPTLELAEGPLDQPVVDLFGDAGAQQFGGPPGP